MQAVTQVSSLGEQSLFFTSKSNDSSFADILYTEEARTPDLPAQPASNVASSAEPTEQDRTRPASEQQATNKTEEKTQNTKEPDKTETAKKVDDKISEKTEEEKDNKKTVAIVPFILLAPKQTLANVDKNTSLSIKWTEIPPATLRVGGKSVVSEADKQTANAMADLANLMKDLSNLATMTAELKGKPETTPDQLATLSALISKISKSIEKLESQAITQFPEMKEMLASLKTLIKAPEAGDPRAIGSKNRTIDGTKKLNDIENTIAQLLHDLQGTVEEAKETKTFKSELVKGMDLTPKNNLVQTVSANTQVDNEAPLTTEATTAVSNTEALDQDAENIILEKPKAHAQKTENEPLKPLFHENLNAVNTDTKSAPAPVAAKAELAGTPQTTNIEKQTAIMSQFRTFLSVNKLRSETEVTLRLHPRELGEIKIQISRIENQATHEPATLSAKFHVNSEMVKSVLESNFNMLKDSLQQQGNLAQMSVDVQTSGSQNQGFQGSTEDNTGRSSSFFKDENIIVNTPTYSPPTHTGDLDRVA